MSDYTVQATWSTKDALATGSALKGISATELGVEFAAISTALNTKWDDIADVPSASTAAAGKIEIATDAEVLTGTDTARAITAANLDAWAEQNGGLVKDLVGLADPGADRLLFWDDSLTTAAFLSVGTNLSLSGTTLSAPTATLEAAINHDNLTGFVANEHIDHSAVSVSAGAGLSGGGTIAANRTLALDFSGLTNRTIDDTAATDSIVFNNAGTMEQIDFQDMGIRVVNAGGGNQTFAAADANTLQYVGATGRTFTIPPNSSVAFHIGAIIYLASTGAGTITVDPGAGVSLTSFIAQGSTANRTVMAGGTAALIKVGTDHWLLSGDIT